MLFYFPLKNTRSQKTFLFEVINIWKEVIKGKTGFSSSTGFKSNKTKTDLQCKRCRGTGKITRSPDGKKVNCNRCGGSSLDKDTLSTKKGD